MTVEQRERRNRLTESPVPAWGVWVPGIIFVIFLFSSAPVPSLKHGTRTWNTKTNVCSVSWFVFVSVSRSRMTPFGCSDVSTHSPGVSLQHFQHAYHQTLQQTATNCTCSTQSLRLWHAFHWIRWHVCNTVGKKKSVHGFVGLWLGRFYIPRRLFFKKSYLHYGWRPRSRFALRHDWIMRYRVAKTRGMPYLYVVSCRIFIDRFPRKSPIISGSFAKRDLQLKASYACSPPCCKLQ